MNMGEKCLKCELNPSDQMNTHLDQEPSPQAMQNCFNVCKSIYCLPPFSMGTSQQTMSRHPWVNVKGLRARTQWKYLHPHVWCNSVHDSHPRYPSMGNGIKKYAESILMAQDFNLRYSMD